MIGRSLTTEPTEEGWYYGRKKGTDTIEPVKVDCRGPMSAYWRGRFMSPTVFDWFGSVEQCIEVSQ